MNREELLKIATKGQLKNTNADVRVGDTVKVHYRIREGNKERVQVFTGLVIATKGGKTLQGSFTVRKVVSGVGVERTFPMHSPWIIKIERVKTGKVRRAKLNFVRKYALSSKFKLKDKNVAGTVWEEVAKEQEDIQEEQAEVENAEVVAEDPEVEEAKADDVQVEEVGESGGDASESVSAEEPVQDSEEKSSN